MRCAPRDSARRRRATVLRCHPEFDGPTAFESMANDDRVLPNPPLRTDGSVARSAASPARANGGLVRQTDHSGSRSSFEEPMEQRHGTRGSRIAWPARVLIGGLAGAAASASWFLWLSPALFIIGQALGLGTSVLFLLRRPERELAAGNRVRTGSRRRDRPRCVSFLRVPDLLRLNAGAPKNAQPNQPLQQTNATARPRWCRPRAGQQRHGFDPRAARCHARRQPALGMV